MDSLIEEAGANGRFQKISLIFMSAIQMIASMTFFVTIFNVAEPTLTCRPLHHLNSTTNDKSPSTNETTCAMWTNHSSSQDLGQPSPYICEFDKIYYDKTIINEWGLLCDKQNLAAVTQTIFLIGNIAAFLSGIVSDKFGRKRATVIFLGLFSFFSIIFGIIMDNHEPFWLSVWNRYVIYCIFQLLSGILSCCLQISIYVHLIELTTDDYHIMVSNVTSYFYIGGQIFVLVVFYFTRSWTVTNWYVTIFSVVSLVPFCLLIPESPRWLAELNRFDEAYEIIEKIAKFNNKKSFNLNKDSSIKLMQAHKNELELQNKIQTNNNLKGLNNSDSKKPISSRRFDIDLSNILGSDYKDFNYLKLLALFVVYNVITLIYVGVTVGITSLSDINPYSMFLFSSIFEFIGIVICHINNYIGRKRAFLLFTSLLSICALFVALLPSDIYAILILKTIFTLIARIFISAGYNTLMCYTAELYEVKIRNTILAFLMCAGCLLSLISPQINLMEEQVWESIPYLIYSACALLSTFIVFFLPETYHFHSPDNGI